MNFKSPGFIGCVVGLTVFFSAIAFTVYICSRCRRQKRIVAPLGIHQTENNYELRRRRRRKARRRRRRIPPVPTGHPPVFCIEDLREPPPLYTVKPRRPRRHSIHEQELWRRLNKLAREIPWIVDRVDLFTKEAEYRSLKTWITRLEDETASVRGLKFIPDNPTDDDLTWIIPENGGGWLGVGSPREISPYLVDDFYVPNDIPIAAPWGSINRRRSQDIGVRPISPYFRYNAGMGN